MSMARTEKLCSDRDDAPQVFEKHEPHYFH